MEQTKREQKRIEFFRFNDKTEEWKKLTVENSDGKVFIATEQGKKGREAKPNSNEAGTPRGGTTAGSTI